MNCLLSFLVRTNLSPTHPQLKKEEVFFFLFSDAERSRTQVKRPDRTKRLSLTHVGRINSIYSVWQGLVAAMKKWPLARSLRLFSACYAQDLLAKIAT